MDCLPVAVRQRIFSFLNIDSWIVLASLNTIWYGFSKASLCYEEVVTDGIRDLPQIYGNVCAICNTCTDVARLARTLAGRMQHIRLNMCNEDCDLGLLPSWLRSACFTGREFRGRFQPGILPCSLQTLTFDNFSEFDTPFLPGVLPCTLISLTLGDFYNQPFAPGVLPPSLTSLIFSSTGRFNHPLPQEVIPSSLERLNLPDKFCNSIFLGSTRLTRLHFGSQFDCPLESGALPLSLLSLTFSTVSRFQQNIGHGVLPSSLQTLTLGYFFSWPLVEGVLPLSLTSLALGGGFNHRLATGVLPQSLTSLVFGTRSTFDQPIEPGDLPQSLTTLMFDENSEFNQPIVSGSLPAKLVTMSFGRKFDQALVPGALPSSLTYFFAVHWSFAFQSTLFARITAIFP
jgi:hypothetical protein